MADFKALEEAEAQARKVYDAMSELANHAVGHPSYELTQAIRKAHNTWKGADIALKEARREAAGTTEGSDNVPPGG